MAGRLPLEAELTDIFEGRGRARYGLESISRLEYALQTAERAEAAKYPEARRPALAHFLRHLRSVRLRTRNRELGARPRRRPRKFRPSEVSFFVADVTWLTFCGISW